MKRRTFLKYNAMAALSLTPLFANPHHGSHDNHSSDNQSSNAHSNHNMSHNHHNMGHGTRHSALKKHIRTDFITLENEHIQLLDRAKIPQKQHLEPLTLLRNKSSQKGVFEAEIEIKEENVQIAQGRATKCYVYRDMSAKSSSLLAPKIEVYEGDLVRIHVRNSLKEDTTIHWHGLPVPPSQDGNPMDPIVPGGSRVYEFRLPNNCAGTYWYHPHPHYITSKQVYMGLAGAFVVKAKQDLLRQFGEQDWFISDLRLDSNAQIPGNALSDWLDGREGELVFINGKLESQINLDSPTKIRIYNATAARYLNLKIEGAKFLIVGTDGGLLEKPQIQDSLFLCPAARMEVFIQNAKKGEAKLTSHWYDRDKMMPKKDEPKILQLATLNLTYQLDLKALPTTLRAFPKLPKAQTTLEVSMSEDHAHMHGLSTKSKEEIRQSLVQMFLINNQVFDMQRMDLKVQKGIVHDIVVTNKSHMDHPFHIHGTQFEVIESVWKGKSEKPKFRALHDTINVRPNEVLRLRMRQDFSGVRMFHCHILEHEDLGMMGNLLVE